MSNNTLQRLFRPAQLEPWLQANVAGASGDATWSLLAGGASNLSARARFDDVDLVVRRGPPGHKASGAHDMVREANIIACLHAEAFPVPAVHAVDSSGTVLDGPFFVMDFVDGLIPRRSLPDGVSWSEAQCDAVCQAFIDNWRRLHSVNLRSNGLKDLDRGDGYVQRQITGWSKRYRDAKTPDAPDFERVMGWLDGQAVADAPHALIHNDYRLDNLVLDSTQPQRIRAVLDWELATVGCPLMDLGASLAYWIQADDDPLFHSLRRQPSHLPGMWTRQQLLAEYARQAATSVGNLTFYEVYGLFRLAGIAQQIYYRHFHGQFKTDESAGFIHGVRLLEQRALALID